MTRTLVDPMTGLGFGTGYEIVKFNEEASLESPGIGGERVKTRSIHGAATQLASAVAY